MAGNCVSGGLCMAGLDYLRGPNILGKFVRLWGGGIEIVVGRTRRERRMKCSR